MYEQILEQFEQLLQQEITDFGADFAKNEQAVWKTILALGHAALERIVGRQRNGYHGSHIRCACGGWMKFVQHRSRDIHSLLGWIELTRAYYHCAKCGASCAPYDQTSGLGSQQLSPALAKACCMLAVDDSFEQTSRKIENLFGQQVCDDNEEQMRYDVFRGKGYQIGSGPVEGACKHVVGDRLKRSGMIWSRAGSSSVLALRVSWLNRQWEQVWSQKPLVA